MAESTIKSVLFLLGLAAVIYAFSPQSGLVSAKVAVEEPGSKIYPLTIKDRTLADPTQSDLRVKVGEKAILSITTDEDGSLSLQSQARIIFNPVFYGIANNLTIPTDQAGSYQLVFRPGASPDQEKTEILIGTVVVER